MGNIKNKLARFILAENEPRETSKFYCKNESFVKNYYGEYCKKQCIECASRIGFNKKPLILGLINGLKNCLEHCKFNIKL